MTLSTTATSRRRLALCRFAGATLAVLLGTVSAFGQARGPRRATGGTADGVPPAEIQRLFDAYVMMQAQQELQLSDEQYPRFLARVKDLQAVRQRGFAERARVIQEMRRLDAAPTLDENQAHVQLRALADFEARTAGEVRDALAGIDQVLDPRQQIRFRIFEEQMERRKMDLLVRARQASRQRDQN